MPDQNLNIKITTAADTAGAREATRAIDDIGESAKKVSQAPAFKSLDQGAEELKKVAGAAQKSGQALSSLSRQTAATQRIFGGLAQASRGGISGLMGLGNAARGVIDIFKSMGPILGGGLGLAIGAVTAGVAVLRRIAGNTQKEIDAIHAESKKNSDALKQAFAAQAADAVKSLAEQRAAVEALDKAYQDLLSRMDSADARAKQSTDLQRKLQLALIDQREQEALAGATTPEQRDKISATFAAQRTALQNKNAGTDIENKELGAKLRLDTAQDQRAKLEAQLYQLQAEARQKEQAAADATIISGQRIREHADAQQKAIDEAATQNADRRAAAAAADPLSRGLGLKTVVAPVTPKEVPLSDDAIQSIITAQKKRNESDLAQDNLAKTGADIRGKLEKQDADIATARNTLESVTIEKQILASVQRTGALREENTARIAATTQQNSIGDARTANANAETALSLDPDNPDKLAAYQQTSAVLAELGRANRATKAFGEAVTQHAQAVTQVTGDTTRKVNNNARQIANMRSLH